MSRRDAETRGLIDALIAVEERPWPASRAAYADALMTLAVRCEATPTAVAEVYRWLSAELAATLSAGDADVRLARADALRGVAAGIAGLLLRFRAGLDRARRPNLVSMLRFQVRRRASDILRRERQYRARFGPLPERSGLAVGARGPSAVRAAQLVERLRRGDAADRALLLVAEGHAIAEAARRCGVSRQAVYRRRVALLAATEALGADRPCHETDADA